MCVCTYVYLCLGMCVRVLVCVFLCVCSFVLVYMYIQASVCVCVCVCVCMRLVSVFARVSVTLMFSGDLQWTFELELRADFPRDDPAPYNPLCVSDHFFAILSCSV